MERTPSPKEILAVAAIVAFAAVVGLAAPRQWRFLGTMETRLADLRVATLSPRQEQHPDIIVVGVTEATLASLSYRSPFDRAFLARLLRFLDDAGARAIGLDILFDQPTEAAKDETLCTVLAGMRAPVFAAWADEDDGLTRPQVAFMTDYLKGIARGHASLRPDPDDGTVRRIHPWTASGGVRVPSLPAAIAAALGAFVPDQPVALAYRMAPDGARPPFRVFPAHLAEKLPKPWFAGKVVLIGAVLPLIDRHPTPLSQGFGEGGQEIPGVMIHAHALAQFLDGRRAPRARLGIELVLVVGLAVVGFLIALVDVPIPVKTGAVVLVLAGLWIGGFALFKYGAVLVPLVSPSLSIVLSGGIANAYLGRRERHQKRFLRRAFGRYISPAVVDRLVADPARLTLGGERREVTFIFTDIASFTSLMEKSEPEVILPLLNAYLDGMCRIVLEHDGTMDKIVGDAVVGFFGAPADQPDHAARAVHCALALDAFANDYAARQKARGIDFGITRIGVNTGVAAVGNFGGESFFNYTAHGDTVNTAARMESVNKHLGTRLCVAATTVAGCPDVAFRPVGSLVLKGKSEGVEAFEPLSETAAALPATALYREAYAMMEAGDPGAAQAFTRLLEDYPGDTLAVLHADRLAAGETGTTIVLKEK